MNLRNLYLGAATTAMLAAFSACQSDKTLTVTNVDQPDVTRAFSTADGIEAILRGGFSQIFGATHATTAAIWPAALVLSFENYGSVSNFGMNLPATISRGAIDNNPGYPTPCAWFR